ncbi:MAG: thiamine phosphate synthase [Myxococcota bacterium]
MTWLDGLRLVAITDLDVFTPDALVTRWEEVAQRARTGTVAIDLRAPTRTAREVLHLGVRLKEIAQQWGQRLFVNDRLDIARLLEADGMHLREDSVSSIDARRIHPQTQILRACHRVNDVASIDADAVLLSPVLEARKGNTALGLTALSAAKGARKSIRLFALGGIDAARAASCIEAGADGVAAIGAVFGGSVGNVEALLTALRVAREGS